MARSSVYSEDKMKIGGAGVIKSITSLANCTSTSLDGENGLILNVNSECNAELGASRLELLRNKCFLKKCSTIL